MEADFKILKTEKTTHGVVELRSDNILVFRPDITSFKNYNVRVLEDLHEVFVRITESIPRPYLCDNRYVTGIVNKDEQAYMNKFFGDFATRAALVTHSSVVRILVNGYNSIFKPKVEVRLFKSETDAVRWLLDSV